jgi:uncharacterized HAD superfamily protein
MKIGFDMDGVLADWNGPMLKALNAQCNTAYAFDPGGPKVWDWPQDQFGFTDDEVHEVWRKRIHPATSTFWQECPPLEQDLMDRVAQLQFQHELYFITQRSGESAKLQTERWLNKLGIIYPTVLISAAKMRACRALNLDIYIDDKPENLIVFPHNAALTRRYLRAAPYNKWVLDTTPGAYGLRVKTTAEMLDMEGL